MTIPYGRQKIWNLKMLEKKLADEGRGNNAFTIRQVLNMISPNWRDATDYKQIKLYEKGNNIKLKIIKSKGIVKDIIVTILTSDSLKIHVNPDAVEVVEK